MEENSYEKQEIVELSEREQCRLKLPIFFGDRSNHTHSIREVLANSRDEILNNFDNGKIYINLYDDNETIEILDTGRGINLQGETNGVANYYLLLEKLWAGGNHNNLELGIASTGTNSVGLTCTNYCAELFEATSYKNNKYFKASYKDGGHLISVTEGDSKIEHGTRIKFKQDKQVYTQTKFNANEIETLCNKLASTTPNIEYIYTYNDEAKTFHYDSQIDYLEKNAKNNITKFIQLPDKHYETNVTVDNKKYIEKDNISVNISLSTEPLIETYLNGTYLIEGGSILDGIAEGIKKFLQKDIKDKKIKLTNQDILMSFNIHGLFTSTNPSFSGQTKFSSASPLYKKLCTQYIQENLEIIKKENINDYNKFIDHVTKVNNLNVKSEDTIKKFREKLGSKSNGLSRKIQGLKDCDMKHSTLEERIFIVDEGLSANSTIIEAFDNRYMGCLGLRGRFINSLKANVKDVLNNEPALGIIQALNCGIEIPEKERKLYKGFEPFNMNNLRYGSMAILCDYDGAGRGITLSLLTFFYKFMPQLLKEGRIYVVISPRYEVRDKNKKSYYAYNEKERDNIIKKLGNKFYDVSIRKGLGEFNKDEFWDLVLSPEARKNAFIKVTYDENENIEYWFDTLMGNDIDNRKKFIKENIINIKLDEID